jgi:hypothetical protein
MNDYSINAENNQMNATQRSRRRWFQFSLRTLLIEATGRDSQLIRL